MHDSVYDLAGDDPRIAKFLRTALTQLADNPDPPLREMAQGVLDGHVDLRQAATSDAYAASFNEGSRAFWSYYDNLDETERQELARTGKHQLDTLLDGPDLSPTT
ncbi:hypothetical protein [Couchioplanes caeruleus]|uniref:Uncharacterized protein n=2 Tax=Couchioplanes caeruleus TaxID=56438 RepID=A0A1K0GPF5_9ACTN|nr:hypothetical protein [Couchioplanes caeruleus]OJF13004.1 hypothetical protein BG844_17695 [Couchioplanes caeruleus subsp. caeruleus]ROP33606.1 hypothetical protein EDD30_6621 [Couchioplanes caeruleus]